MTTTTTNNPFLSPNKEYIFETPRSPPEEQFACSDILWGIISQETDAATKLQSQLLNENPEWNTSIQEHTYLFRFYLGKYEKSNDNENDDKDSFDDDYEDEDEDDVEEKNEENCECGICDELQQNPRFQIISLKDGTTYDYAINEIVHESVDGMKNFTKSQFIMMGVFVHEKEDCTNCLNNDKNNEEEECTINNSVYMFPLSNLPLGTHMKNAMYFLFRTFPNLRFKHLLS